MIPDAVSTPGSWQDLLGRLAGAALVGAAIGVNREMQQKPAGLRTHAMVSLGAAVFALLPLRVFEGAESIDAHAVSRVLQGVITGVGFIGGGVILHRGATREVYGLTTATSIWLAAALGAAAGLGLWRTALIAAGLGLAVLIVGAPIDTLLRRFSEKTDQRKEREREAATHSPE